MYIEHQAPSRKSPFMLNRLSRSDIAGASQRRRVQESRVDQEVEIGREQSIVDRRGIDFGSVQSLQSSRTFVCTNCNILLGRLHQKTQERIGSIILKVRR